MNPITPHWTRLAIDLDAAGNPIGCSILGLDAAGELQQLAHWTPDPFETVVECADLLATYFEARCGRQLALFDL